MLSGTPIIFDFDGVIGDTFETAIEAHLKFGNYTNREAAEEEVISYASKKPNHTRSHKLSEDELNGQYEWTVEFGKNMHRIGVPLFKDFVEVIEKLPTERKAVVSSGSQAYVIPALAETKIEPTHILAFENHHSKEEKIEIVCKDWGIDLSDVYYITDTLADVYELRDMISEDKLLGVSWGFCGYDNLSKELKEEYLLKEPEDLNKILGYA